MSFELDWLPSPWWSEDKFHVVCIHMCSPLQVRERLCHDSCVVNYVKRGLFNLIKVKREVAEAKRLKP